LRASSCLLALAVLGCKPTAASSPTAASQPIAPAAPAPPALSMLHGARPLPSSPTPPHGREETQACVAGHGADVAEDLRATLATRWQGVQIVPTRAVGGRWVVIGHDESQSVSGVVDEVRRGPCADGEVFVRLGTNDIPPEPGPRTPGASGVRAAAGGRMPTVLPAAKP
jgi:hypothetical protein